ncbi:MAG: hypothetical protein AAGC85_20825, partial [Bacteroidota bacterium]
VGVSHCQNEMKSNQILAGDSQVDYKESQKESLAQSGKEKVKEAIENFSWILSNKGSICHVGCISPQRCRKIPRSGREKTYRNAY